MNRKIITLAAVGLALLSTNVASARCRPAREPSCPSKCQYERQSCPSKCPQERPCPSKCPEERSCPSKCQQERPERPCPRPCPKKSDCLFGITGWYVQGTGSADLQSDFSMKNNLPATEDLEFDLGWNVAGSVGAIIDRWRLEIEGSYRTDDLDSINATERTGDISHFALMFNVLYDIPLYNAFSLYAGGGVGVDFFNLEIDTYTGTGGNSFSKVDDDDTLFAWQLMGGLSYCLTDQFTIFAGYRFFATTVPDDFSRTVGVTARNTIYGDNATYSHSIEGGIRFNF